jgi:5-methylcytosine-specific restriction endonuclease McrA
VLTRELAATLPEAQLVGHHGGAERVRRARLSACTRREPRVGGDEEARMGSVSHSLVLNASYEPLGVVSSRRALVLVLRHKAVTLEESERVVHSASLAAPLPVVVRLTRYVRVPYRAAVPLTRRAILARDGGRCVYCGATAATIDHVVPRSRGGAHTWDNVVSACHRCNHVKADRAVADLGWRLHAPPVQPMGAAWRVLCTGRSDPRWLPYLDGHGAVGSGEASA